MSSYISHVSSKVSVPQAAAVYLEQFVKFAPLAWARYDSSVCELKDWARSEARAFFHMTHPAVPFAKTYTALLKFAETMMSRPVVVTKPNYLANTFVEDGQQTGAEQKAARKYLNAILYSEFNTWYDAYKAEAEENTDGSGASADLRFSWHCAKILKKCTGISEESLTTVVEAWLLQKSE